MKTYTYEQITELTEQIIADEMTRAEKETDERTATQRRGFAGGAWLLWSTLTVGGRHEARVADCKRFEAMLGLSK